MFLLKVLEHASETETYARFKYHKKRWIELSDQKEDNYLTKPNENKKIIGLEVISYCAWVVEESVTVVIKVG